MIKLETDLKKDSDKCSVDLFDITVSVTNYTATYSRITTELITKDHFI